MSGTRGGGRVSGHSVITLMHRPPSISSPHLRLRILATTTPARLSLPLPLSLVPLETKEAQSDRSTRRSIESMGQRGSPICLRTNRNCWCPPPIVPPSTMGTFHKSSPRIFVASLGPDTHLEKKFQRKNSTPFPFSSSFLRSFSRRNQPIHRTNDHLLI